MGERGIAVSGELEQMRANRIETVAALEPAIARAGPALDVYPSLKMR